MFLQVLASLVVLWLPGAAIFRLPWLDRDRRAALDGEERLYWSVILSVAVSLASALALAAVHRYSFQRLVIVDLIVAAAAAWVTRGQWRLGTLAPRPGLSALIPLALVFVGLWRFFPSSEYIIGGKDPGVYLNEGIQIAQRGRLVIHDPVVASVPAPSRDLFFPSHERPDYYGVRFMGFFIQDPGAGTVVGQFPHLFPASMAIGYGIDGLNGARRTVGIWAILGVLAVYFAGARLVGRTAAAAAAALLTLHIIEVWFARYPNAEVVMQTLLFAALLANARAHVDGDRFFAPVAAVLIGLLLFLRYDTILGIAGVGAGLVCTALNGQRPRASFLAVLALTCALAAIYLLGPMRAYTYLPIVFLTHLPWWEYVLLGLTAGTAATALRLAITRPESVSPLLRWLPTVVVALVWLLALYALTLRHPGGKLTDYDAFALRTFTSFYLTLPALLAALAGLALVARQGFWRDPALFMTFVVFSCIFFFKIRISPDHFWMTRRFLPVILPCALLFASAAAFSGVRGGWSRANVMRGLLGAVFVGLLGAHYARASQPVVDHVEYAGLIPRIEHLSGQIGENDLVIVESRDAGSDVHVMALPLAYIYARNVLVLNLARPDKPAFAAFLEWARRQYPRVLFLGGGGTDLLSYRYGVRPVASERFQVPEYEAPYNAYPRVVRRKEFDFGVYEFTLASPTDGLWFDLDVGVRDDLHVLRFHAKEQAQGHTFRWTGATSYVAVTVIHPTSREVTVWMSSGGRPARAEPADVAVYLHNQRLGSVRVGDGFGQYTFQIPADLAARAAAWSDPVELKIVTPTWKPREVLGTSDDRDLGVMLDRVTVR